ncbi:MAG: hypothetical protein V4737_03965 [Curtobacterium sp.]
MWTFVPVLGVASCVLLLTQQSGQVWLYAAVLLAVGVVLYFVAHVTGGRASRGRGRDRQDTQAG